MTDPMRDSSPLEPVSTFIANAACASVVSARIDAYVLPAGRPAGAVSIDAYPPGCRPAHASEVTYLMDWQTMATLQASLMAWRETLPEHVGDQYDAMVDDLSDRYTAAVLERGRPE